MTDAATTPDEGQPPADALPRMMDSAAAWWAVVDANVRNPTLRDVARAIAFAVTATGVAHPTLDDLVAAVGCTAKRADKAVADLEDAGWLVVHRTDLYAILPVIPKEHRA